MARPVGEPAALTTPTFTLEETARRVDHYRLVESRLFEIIGGWVPAVPEAEAKLRLHVDARTHGWHAELWRESRHEAAPGAGAPARIERHVEALLEAVAGASRTVERLVGVYRVVLPRQVATYRQHLARTSELCDGPTVRRLGLVLRDEVEDWREGEQLLQSLLRSEADVRRAAGHQADLEALLGGGRGTLTPPVW